MLDVNAATDEDNIEKILISDFIGGSSMAMIQFIFEGATLVNANGTDTIIGKLMILKFQKFHHMIF